MSKPSSFSTICTSNCAFELIGLLLSLSIYHTNEHVYILCDSKTRDIINNMTPQPQLQINWFIELDKYSGLDRQSMVAKGIWSDFQMAKANIIKYTLNKENDTLFLDSDIIITNIINDIDYTKDIGVSPQYIKKQYLLETGYYNGGMLWTKNKNVPIDWIEYTKKSRYFDQASIDDLVNKYDYFEFGENYNLQCWRYLLSNEPNKTIASYITSKPHDKLYYKSQPLKFIHTHFLDPRFKEFNLIILNHLQKANMYKILAIIYRVINNKWLIKIPKQPLNGIAFHKNDSFREIPIMLKNKNKDLDISFHTQSIHCWLEPNILLYDRPTIEWCNNELNSASLLLLGNGSVDVEGKLLCDKYSNLVVHPWIFWPRKPMLLEKLLTSHNLLSYTERNIESIFIGNIENNVQDKYRANNNWNEVISEYHCTKSKEYLFSHEEYLLKLRGAKYGLCLRGYGSKCHREIELMAWGTVPIITPHVNVSSYMEPLIENVHYIYAENTNQLVQKLKLIDENKWRTMSNSCHEWYMKNVHSSNFWNNMISNILFH
jgi:hypothetical protein